MSIHSTSNGDTRPDSNAKIVRFTRSSPCPVCGGCEKDPRGEGKRCFGFIAGDWLHCTRPEFANGCTYYPGSETYGHRFSGQCKCGTRHGPLASLYESENHGSPNEIECIYPYCDATGKTIFEVVRLKNPKGFRQRQPGQTKCWSVKGIEPVLYRLTQIIAADPLTPVWIVEGEKDVDSLTDLGLVATTNPCGAGKWKPAYSDVLKGRIVRIIPDNDDKGRQHARQVTQSLQGKAVSVKTVNLPDLPAGGDVSDWLASGGTAQKLEWLAEQSEVKTLNDEPIVSKEGLWIRCVKNSEIWLLNQDIGPTIRFDSFSQKTFIGENVISDEAIIELVARIESEKRVAWSDKHIRESLMMISRKQKFSSLTDWLDILAWDLEHRMNSFFCDAYNVPLTPYTAECARVLFLSAVTRAYEPGCQADVMVVLIGSQGIGKSMGIFHLVPYPDWYTDDLGSDLTGDKPGMGLQGKWLFEFSEFTRINRATNDAVKSFISRRVDHYREPWGHFYMDYPRSCIFIGTTNDPTPLRDTENRRFMPITCNQGDITWIKENRNQLWAEAVFRYKSGEKCYTQDREIVTSITDAQESARSTDAWETILEEKLYGYNRVTMHDAAEKLDVKIDRLDKPTQARIGTALRTIGFERRVGRIDGKLYKLWERLDR